MNSTAKVDDFKQSRRSEQVRKCKQCCKKFVAFLFSHVGLCCLVVAYSIMGGFVFMRIEGPHESHEDGHIEIRRKFNVERIWDLTIQFNVLYKENWTAAVETVLKEFQNDVFYAAKDKGWNGDVKKDKQWSFAGALLYSVTVITTIGYGHITPKTATGRVATIFYALIGIPLTLLCLANIGGLMADIFRFLYKNVCCGLCCVPCKGKGAEFSKPKHKRKNTKRVVKQRTETINKKKNNPKTKPAEAEKEKNKKMFRLTFSNKNGKPSNSTTSPSLTSPSLSSQPPPLYSTICPPSPTVTAISSNDLPQSPEPIDTVEGRFDDSQVVPIATTPLNENTVTVIVDDDDPDNIFEEADDDDVVDVDSSSKTDPDEKVTVPISLCVLLMAGYIFSGAMLFSLWEKWDYLEGSYFCFITLSTIGFGDFVPGANVDSWSSQEKQVLCTMYLLFGLAFIAMCFELMQEEVRAKFRWLGRKIGLVSKRNKKLANKNKRKSRKSKKVKSEANSDSESKHSVNVDRQ
ncbi:potassium channel subfamily K member 18-like [Tubulanus polymorphus]|uniref:potassium channel subfamily K member 18-like n=1 Tax=Tubulanus polymorphus TaxID=672921 RepID=UPI003DA2F81B